MSALAPPKDAEGISYRYISGVFVYLLLLQIYTGCFHILTYLTNKYGVFSYPYFSYKYIQGVFLS